MTRPRKGSRYWLIVRAGLAVDIVVFSLRRAFYPWLKPVVAVDGLNCRAYLSIAEWKRLVRAGFIVDAPKEQTT